MAQSYETLIIRSSSSPLGVELKLRYRKLSEVWSQAFAGSELESKYQVKDISSVVSSNQWIELGAYIDDPAVQTTEQERELEVLATNPNYVCYACFEAGKYDASKLGEGGWFRTQSKWGSAETTYSSDFTTSLAGIAENFTSLKLSQNYSGLQIGDLDPGDQLIISHALDDASGIWERETLDNQLYLSKDKAYILGRIPSETPQLIADYEASCILIGVDCILALKGLSLQRRD